MRLVRVVWRDVIEHMGVWHTEAEALEWASSDDWIVHQVGWVLEDTDDYLLLTSKYNTASADRESSYGGLTKIPKPFIQYITTINLT